MRWFFRAMLLGVLLYMPIEGLKRRQLAPVGGWRNFWSQWRTTWLEA